MSKNLFNKIVAKLERLDEYLKYLSEIQKVNKKTFINDFHFHGLAERYLQLSIELIMDIGKLIIIDQNMRKPEDNQDIFTILEERKVIPATLAKSFNGISGFRNVLVHDYEKIDREIVYQKLKNNLDQFKNFKKAIIIFLKKHF